MNISTILFTLLALCPCQVDGSWLSGFLTMTTTHTTLGNSELGPVDLRSRKLVRGVSAEDYYPNHNLERRTKMGNKGKSKGKGSDDVSFNQQNAHGSSKGKGKSKGKGSSDDGEPQVQQQSDDCGQFHPNNSNGNSGSKGKGKGSSKGKGSKGSDSTREFSTQNNDSSSKGKGSKGKGSKGRDSHSQEFSTQNNNGSGKGKGSKGKGSKGSDDSAIEFSTQNNGGSSSKGKGSKGSKGSGVTDNNIEQNGVLCPDENPTTHVPTDTPEIQQQGNPSPTTSPVAFNQDGNPSPVSVNPTTKPTDQPSVKPTLSPTIAPSKAPTSSPTSTPSKPPTPVPTQPPSDAPPCDTDITVTCTIKDDPNLSCQDMSLVDGGCSGEGPIDSITLTYTAEECGNGEGNAQGAPTACEDVISCAEDAAVVIECSGSPNGPALTVTPKDGSFPISQGKQFSVSNPSGGSLPDMIECTTALSSSLSVCQINTFDVSGDVELDLKDSFGGLQIEACDEKNCLQSVVLTYFVENIGQVDMEVRDVTGTVTKYGEIDTKQMVDDITPNPVPWEEGHCNVETTFATTFDYCTEQIITVTGAITAAPENPNPSTCFDDVSLSIPIDTFTEPPTPSPTAIPTRSPTTSPSQNPTRSPTSVPTSSPSSGPTSHPSRLPTFLPTKATSGPSKHPTLSPSDNFGQNAATKVPSVAPTKMPSPSPSVAPTKEPTAPPSFHPTDSPTMEHRCEPAFVHCSHGSTCFLSSTFNNGVVTIDPSEDYKTNGWQWTTEEFNENLKENAWGWSTFLGTGGCSMMCEVYIGATGCDTSIGQEIGTAKITSSKVDIDLVGYESASVQIFAGHCEGNDAGKHMTSNGACNEDEIAMYAADAARYPFRKTNNPRQSKFSIDQYSTGDSSPWSSGYNIFPLASPTRPYITIAMNVCPVASEPTTAPTKSPTESPTEAVIVPNGNPSTASPSSRPTATPSKQATMSPTSSPSNSPTTGPTSSPTVSPTTSVPTVGPTSEPTRSPVITELPTSSTEKPTSSPTSGPTKSPSMAPTTSPVKVTTTVPTATPTALSALGSCSPAYVYCPCTSTCFLDPNFNQGFLPGSNGSHSSTSSHAWGRADEDFWGWNIALEDNHVFPMHCEIWMGAVGCSRHEGFKVGQVEITDGCMHFTLNEGYVSNSFSLYAGQCEGFNGGANANFGYCNPADVADWAASSEEYPFVNSGDQYRSTYQFDATNTQDVFPINTKVTKYMSGFVEICEGEPATDSETASPTFSPSNTDVANGAETKTPTASPSAGFGQTATTRVPTLSPSSNPTLEPSALQTAMQSMFPSEMPSVLPSNVPSSLPTWVVTSHPTVFPTSLLPTVAPTDGPTSSPVLTAPPTSSTKSPTTSPTEQPSVSQTGSPTKLPSLAPTSSLPTVAPTDGPTSSPVLTAPPTSSTKSPTASPTEQPSLAPTSSLPTVAPTDGPTSSPVLTAPPTLSTKNPTNSPSTSPTERPSSGPTYSPTKAPVGLPTETPTTMPTSTPTTAPIWSPTSVPTESPTIAPISSPTSGPTVEPTIHPSKGPSPLPTKTPSVTPTLKPTLVFNPDSTTSSPTNLPTQYPTENGCMDAWVWCPGATSKCFSNSTFNGGNPGQGWGWSIDVNGESGLDGCSKCEIWANSNCDRTTGVLVGTADFNHHYAALSLKSGYTVSSASLYGGFCEGSDGGDAASNRCACKPDLIAAHSSNPSLFPIQKTFNQPAPGYTFTDHDQCTTNWVGGQYPVFPLGGPHRKYVSAHLQVCPC